MNAEEQANGNGPASHWNDLAERTGTILDVREEVEKERTRTSAVVERTTRVLSLPTFFLGMVVLNVGWMVVNLPIMPWEPWDPYPFMFLATLASVEAPLLSLLILMHQERDLRIGELREETQLQVALHTERELTMALRLINELQDGLGVPTRQDRHLLEVFEENLDPERLMKHLRKELDRAEGRT